jgi:hypothetical protein
MRRSLRPARRKIGTGDIQRARRAPAPDSGKRKSWWTADATDAQKDLRRRLRNALPIEKADSGSSVCRCGTPAGWSPCRPPAVVLRHNGEPNELFNTWGWGWYAAGTISQRPRPTGDTSKPTPYHACFGTRLAVCRAAGRPKGGVSPPTPRWSAPGSSDRQSCQWQR